MKFEMDIPQELVNYLKTSDKLQEIERDALLIYPYYHRGCLSIRKAAEIVGIDYLTLLGFYKDEGFSLNVQIEKENNHL